MERDEESPNRFGHCAGCCCRSGFFLDPLRLEQGETLPTGRLPINPSGGFLSFGEATTAMGVFQVCELGWQMRDQAGPRQVPDAKLGLAQTLGLGGNGTAVIVKC